MSAIVPSTGATRQLDSQAEPEEEITPEQVQDAPRLARLLMRLLRDIAILKRKWAPRRMDFEDYVTDDTGTLKHRFNHGFGGRVRWYCVGCKTAASGPELVEHSDTNSNTLVLVSYVIGTLTIRVEEAG